MKVLRFTAVLLFAVMLIGLVSCGGDDSSRTSYGTTTPAPTTPPPEASIELVDDGYTIVYNGDSSADVRFSSLLKTMLKTEGIELAKAMESESSSERELVLTNVLTRDLAPAIKQSYAANTSSYIGAYAMRIVGGRLYVSASCQEAEQILIQKLLSFKTEANEISIPSSLDTVVYFDLAEYKKSGNVKEISAADLMTMTDLVSVKLNGEPVVAIEKDKYSYEYEVNGITVPPTFDGIEILAYHPEMSYTVSMNGSKLTILVKGRDGSTQKEYAILMKTVSEYDVPSTIVNKNGAKGALTLISDDGDQRTSDFFYTVVAPKYPAFKLTVAMPTNKIAKLNYTEDKSAWLKDSDGKYVLTILNNAYSSVIPGSSFSNAANYPTMVDYWKQIVSCEAIELASHSHTHAAWGLTDEQNGKYPAGNVIKELHASAQILRELIGQETPFILRPGGHDDLTSDYFYSLVESDETFIGMRGSNGAAPFLTSTSTRLNTLDKFTTASGRLRIATILVKSYEAAFDKTGSAWATTSESSIEERINAGVGAWTNYVDLAMKNGAWASIGFHSIVPDTENATGYKVFDSQVLQLMDYVQEQVDSGDLWLGSFQDVAKYYFQWSSAELATKVIGDRIEIRLTDKEEDPRFDQALTVKVTVPYLWESAVLSTAGQESALEIHTDVDGTHFVYANIVPSDAVSTIAPAK